MKAQQGADNSAWYRGDKVLPDKVPVHSPLVDVPNHSAPEPEYHGNKCQPESDTRVKLNIDQVYRDPEIGT